MHARTHMHRLTHQTHYMYTSYERRINERRQESADKRVQLIHVQATTNNEQKSSLV